MSYYSPFEKRAPDFRRVDYHVAYIAKEKAMETYAKLRDKKYKLTPEGVFIMPLGHRMKTLNEKVEGTDVWFTAQMKATDLEAEGGPVGELEAELLGDTGTIVSKAIRQTVLTESAE